jgi:serine/threonine protein kinase
MERFGKGQLQKQAKPCLPLPGKRLTPDVQIVIRHNYSSVVKSFLYPYAESTNDARDRILGWSRLSRSSSQAKCQRLKHRRDSQTFGYLEGLREALEEAWERGLVHGDLNRKNILLTCEGFRIVDIEPLICVPTRSGRTLMRTTPPYIAPSDLSQSTLTDASDRLGLKCFEAWISGYVDRPCMALYI